MIATFELLNWSNAAEDIDFKNNKRWVSQQIVCSKDVRESVLLEKMAGSGYVEFEELARLWLTQTSTPDLLTTILNRMSGGIRHTSDGLSHYPWKNLLPNSDAFGFKSRFNIH
ncbi:hypothetical protein GJ496_000530 [Pomphorhynchus laevis]|nr:hypothetical protein GJ496_000530 [Pomphorhynchus laevis]